MLQLHDQPPVRRVLHKLVDKATRQGSLPASIALDKRMLPEVFDAASGEEADYQWGLLKDAQTQGLLHIELKRTSSNCAEYERAPKATLRAGSIEDLRSLLGLAAPTKSPREEWRDALATTLNAPAEVIASLDGFSICIEGRTAVEVVEGLNRLLGLRDKPLLLREASSQAFWSQSKVLDNRTAMVAKLFGLDDCPFPSAPLHLSVRLPADDLQGVLFVENVTTFESLAAQAAPDTAGLALVYSAGARATAKRLVLREGASLFYAISPGYSEGKRQLVEQMLFDAECTLPAFFFGDLDYAGMRILKGLRENFPALTAWEPGYGRLLARLAAGDSHSPAAAEKAGQTDPEFTGCSYADHVLLPALRVAGAFVDQE